MEVTDLLLETKNKGREKFLCFFCCIQKPPNPQTGSIAFGSFIHFAEADLRKRSDVNDSSPISTSRFPSGFELVINFVFLLHFRPLSRYRGTSLVLAFYQIAILLRLYAVFAQGRKMNRIFRFLQPKYYFENKFSFCLSKAYSTKNFKPFYDSFLQHSDNIAVIDNRGSYRYKDILHSSYLLAQKIKKTIPNSNERISFLCSSDATYISVLLACWITGNTAVPLCSAHPPSLLEYYITDSQSNLLISNEKYVETIKNIASKSNLPYFTVDHDILSNSSTIDHRQLLQSEFLSWDSSYENKKGLIIYTSGTTGRPKGVVLNHGTLHSQTSAVIKMWEISSTDSILNSLPLHHIHGIMNALLCPIKVGGTVVFQQKFDTVEAWKHFLNMDNKPRVNLFFAVPTMYAKLVQEFEKVGKSESEARKQCLKSMRLMCSGSASLPVPVFYRWEDITGHRIVERFGMSEIGMALSTQLKGPREAGTVGVPLPDVEVKIRKISDGSSSEVTDLVVGDYSQFKVLTDGETSGELLVRGPNVFKEYWNKEKATKEAFTEDGWFLTDADSNSDKDAADMGYDHQQMKLLAQRTLGKIDTIAFSSTTTSKMITDLFFQLKK
ncbi:Acyl-CoA synthetase family member 3, mitochondrial [Araneus ventricosus]|uniref:Acyl-CoA synthetase family member 3, mitochondrial n=1 Tax=Araneus ventricosus TaxID=182803 RepID=A0A4Y2DB02_ARAVE|nr:Acyl-CoA synthetase family member 3, mitochondrial [Araneus ventricosus]